ncbi:PD-(D/E)XK nuclease family protein [Sediminibacterium goheungense]|uniref:RecB family exonuclease n=1 Tax=Sediminibacterium goheungense TaxID=1086393 RepID=A0A4R6J1V8_9BACT|nr:PD-(D/E)XK nuclease family protein [Sediminibacterium goheungense]TDO29250.1 RecB family exonuclease [Sediminibacterium goheungense]
MIKKLSDHKIKMVNRISPSQYYSAISCPYKLVLANSFGYQSLLPINANAHFGSVLHKMIELISKDVIIDEQSFLKNWSDLIKKKEDELKENGLVGITPLKYFVNDFAFKKNQVKNILLKKRDRLKNTIQPSSTNFFPEKRLENSDKTVTGIVDLIIENDSGTTILDFKTGKVFSDAIDESGITEQTIKIEYEIQLKLYAHLYFLMTKKYPKSLFIVTLRNDFIKVEFENSECEKIYLEALELLSTINFHISNNDMAAIVNPTIENCKYCSYRPACSSYSKWLTVNFEAVNDLFGRVEKINQFSNETIGLELKTQDKLILINGLPLEKKENFESLIGKIIILYNLKKTKQSLNATASSFTVVYE